MTTLTRTLVIMEKDGEAEPKLWSKGHYLEHENVYDNGEAGVRQALVTKLTDHLRERSNFAMARLHNVSVVRMETGHGLALDESCDGPPCPWFGQDRDDTEKLTRRIYSVWWYEDKS